MSHELKEGVELAQIITCPDPHEGTAVYSIQDDGCSAKCASITVSEQSGHMAMVPWAKVVLASGETMLINLANVESVTLARSREAG